MGPVARWAALVFAATTLMSCSRVLQVHLYNNTGDEITVVAERLLLTAKSRLVVAPGAVSEEFNYPMHAQLEIVAKDCTYTYDMAKLRLPDFMSLVRHFAVQAQIEKDFRIHLMPPEATSVMPVADLAAINRDGFPVAPTSRSCGKSAT